MTTGAAGGSSITKGGRKRLRMGCVYTLFVFSLGCWGGITIAKKAIIGPDWMRRATGIQTLMPAFVAPSNPVSQNYSNPGQLSQQPNGPPPQGTDPQSVQPPVQPANSPSANGTNPVGQSEVPGQALPQTGGNTNTSQKIAPGQHPSPQTSGAGLAGTWEVSDSIPNSAGSSSMVTSQYIFDEGGTGEFDTNNKKMYDLHWEDAGEYLLITFVTDIEGDPNPKIKMKYSLSPDHQFLSLVPQGRKDPRAEMYGQGIGLYHRK